MACVFMDSLDAKAYIASFVNIFSAVTEHHPFFKVGVSLAGVLMDWSDAQLAGLTEAVGCEVAERVAKGCQVFT